MEPAFQQYVFCHAIHSARFGGGIHLAVAWQQNHYPLTSREKDRPTPTAQNGTFHRAERRERHRKKERKEREYNRQHSSTGRIKYWHRHAFCCMYNNITYNITYLTPMVVNSIFFSTGTDLLPLISPSTPSEWQHLQAHSSQAATVLLCIFIPLPCGPDLLCLADPSTPHNLSCLFVSDRDPCCQSQHSQPNTALSCLVCFNPLCTDHPYHERS